VLGLLAVLHEPAREGKAAVEGAAASLDHQQLALALSLAHDRDVGRQGWRLALLGSATHRSDESGGLEAKVVVGGAAGKRGGVGEGAGVAGKGTHTHISWDG